MRIHIIYTAGGPFRAYLDQDEAYAERKRLQENEKDDWLEYSVISIPVRLILSTSKEDGLKRNKEETMIRLNLVLDKVSFGKLEKIRKCHGDTTYTQTIKRAIALLEFIDQKTKKR